MRRLALGLVILTAASFVIAQQVVAPAPLATKPATTQRTPEEIAKDIHTAAESLDQAITASNGYKSAAGRKLSAPKAIPALRKLRDLFGELSLIDPTTKGADEDVTLMLLVYGDPETTARVKKIAAGSGADAATAMAQLAAADYTTAENAAGQIKAIDAFQEALKKDKSSIEMIGNFGAIKPMDASVLDHLEAVVKASAPEEARAIIVKEIEDQKKMDATIDKPMEVSGKTVEGKDFSTTAWKGKVILVDFWATWCPPCVKEMPRIKELYQKYHGQGLEVVGVSNDYAADDLTGFAKKENVPWPQLFDPKAASSQDWNSLTRSFGVSRLPTMFLIDRKGVCRSVDAAADLDTQIPKLLAEK